MTTGVELSALELDAIRHVAKVHGRVWRYELSKAWSNGDYYGIDSCYHHVLQSLRNRIGGSGLYKIKSRVFQRSEI